MTIVATVSPVSELTDPRKREMLRLMSAHFDRVDPERFLADLNEKRSVVLVSDTATTRLVGFAAIGLLETTHRGDPLTAIYAGDTVIEPVYWGHPAWLRAWSRHAMELAASATTPVVLFLLLTSTHRSYRFLSGFFRQYYPRPGDTIPDPWRSQRDALVRLKFSEEFDPQAGLVRLREPTPVRPERRDTAITTSSDPDVKFFLEHNPNFLNGDYLVCLTEFSWDNMTPLGRRLTTGSSVRSR